MCHLAQAAHSRHASPTQAISLCSFQTTNPQGAPCHPPLSIKCKQAMDSKGHDDAMPISKSTNLSKVLGVCIGAVALLALVFLVYWFRYSPQSEKIRARRKVHVYRMLANHAQHHPDSGALQLERRERRSPFSQILPWQRERAYRTNEIVLAEQFNANSGSHTTERHQEQLRAYIANVVTRRQYTALHCAALCNADLQIVESYSQ